MSAAISAGKLRRLKALSDDNGRFKMIAIDQRGSLMSTLAKTMGIDAKAVPFEDVARAKEIITRTLAPHATALLTDPIYGYPTSGRFIPGKVAVLLAYEDSGYDKSGPGSRERISKMIPGWSVRLAVRSGADAIKVLLYYHPDASEETRRHQQELMKGVGAECAHCNVPFLLELVAYPLEGSADTVEFARQKPDLVIRSAEEFSRPEYQVDLLKLEFPCNLKFAAEYSRGFYDGKERESAYSLKEVEEHCRALDAASGVPWVILSAGVGIEEFLENVRLATAAGASGYLCGRAIWQGGLDKYPDTLAMEESCRTEGVYNAVRCSAFAEKALPWYDHRKFGGFDQIQVENLPMG